MSRNNALRIIANHDRVGNCVTLGHAVMFELTRETALDTLCCAVETIGGQVISIEDRVQATGRAVGRKTQTIYTVVAIMPHESQES